MSSCDCDLDYPDVYRERDRRARKGHRCSDCSGVISKGEVYTVISGLWDGSWSSYKRCQDCTTVLCDIGKLAGGCDCVPMGELYGYLSEESCYGRLPKENINPVIAAFNAAMKFRGSTRKPIPIYE